MTDDSELQPRRSGGLSLPNIVLIMADQLAASMVGFGGSPVGSTPHLDALAARSVVFDRAYVAHPICMPSRASIITGRFPSSHGARVNGIALRPDSNTFVRSLRTAGYRTGLIGKSHIQDHGDGADIVANMRPDGGGGDALLDDRSWDWFEKRSTVHAAAEVEDYYGFEHVELTVGHGDDIGGHHARWAIEHGWDPALSGGADRALPFDRINALSPVPMHLWRTNLDEHFHSSRFVAERSRQFITDATAAPRPFFLQVSFPDPHHPFTPPGRWFDLYDPADLDVPATFDDPHVNSMAHIKAIAARRGETAGPYGAFAPTASQWREIAARAHGALAMLDHGVGEVLDELDATGVVDDTVVVVCADHGEMFGDHGLMLKSAMHYDNVIRVPLTMSVPSCAASRTTALASLVDIAPTLLDLAGVEPYWGMQGTSLVPIIDGRADSVRDSLLIEEDLDLYGRQIGLTRLRSVVTDAARLTVSEGGGGELFDFASDPDELDNRFDSADDRALQSEMRDRLLDAMISSADRSPFPAQFA